MPFLTNGDGHKKKRKKRDESDAKDARKKSKKTNGTSTKVDDHEKSVAELEARILENRKNYNDIVKLLFIAKSAQDAATEATIALCRIFSKLRVTGHLATSSNLTSGEIAMAEWLNKRLVDYQSMLFEMLHSEDENQQALAVQLIMRLVKVEASTSGNLDWSEGVFGAFIPHLLREDAGTAREKFIQDFFCQYDDIRLQTYHALISAPQNADSHCILDILLSQEEPPKSDADLGDYYVPSSDDGKKNKAGSMKAHKRAAQKAWLSVLQQRILDTEDRKMVLQKLTSHIIPCFTQPETLMDFLTDSFDAGGSIALLALSGLFHLMQERNLDYPDFYNKLYSLLDDDLLHSKHRNRFFRLLDIFLASTHLPAALVASFIKRLSRLALHAPPAAIVAVVPWVYNMLMRHPTCTFMVHRARHPTFAIWQQIDRNEEHEGQETGIEDPFQAKEADPMKTDAIESSLWELDTLRSHYHPNVATLCGIMAEPFTKRNYHLEDFLDHSYDSLIDAEFRKEIKKTPVVEWQIPKHIYTSETEAGGLNEFGKLMQAVYDTT